MTFYIPPVFLFGNKVRHKKEENKAEYKTATETGIQIENRNMKRIAELEEENKKLREELEWYKKQYEHSMWEDRETDIEELIDRNIDVAKRLADK